MKAFLIKKRREVIVWATLGLILLVGAALRFQALDWDQHQYFHPDERAIVSAVINMNQVQTFGGSDSPKKSVDFPPGGLGFFIPNDKSKLRPATDQETTDYRNAKNQGQSYSLPADVVPPDQPVPPEAINFWNPNFSPINPHFFAYGSLPMYLMKLGSHLAGVFTGQNWADWDHITLVGRFLSGIWSLLTIFLTFLVARQLFWPSLGQQRANIIGLLAAAFLSVTVLDIQLAHYATSDVTLTFFIMLALYFSLRLARSGNWRTAILTGIAVGLALSSKVSAAPVVLAAIVAALLYGLYGRVQDSGEVAGLPRMRATGEREEKRYGPDGAALGPRLLRGTLLNLVIAGVAALAAWFVAMPYAFIDFANWSSRVIEEAGMSRGINDLPYTRQYIGSIPFIYQGQNLLLWAVSLPLGLLALGGLAYSLWQSVFRRWRGDLVLTSFIVVYVLITFTGEVKFNRYMLPVIAPLMILAARLLVEFGTSAQPAAIRIFKSKIQNPKSKIAAAIGVFAFAWASVWALSFSHIYSAPHTMNQSAAWMIQNIPNGKAVSQESYWDEGSRVDLAAHGWCDPEETGACQPVMFDMYPDAPNNEKVDYLVHQLQKTDYYVINSNRLYATMPKSPWRYPIQIRFYELLFGGQLGFTPVATFTDYPTVPLLNWQINDDAADESFTVYDHPKVMIFKKTQTMSAEELKGLFNEAAKAPAIATRHLDPKNLPVQIAGQGDGVLSSATAAQARTVDCTGKLNAAPPDCAPGKSLLLDKPVDRQPVIDDMNWNSLANDNQWLAVLLWFLVIQLLGLVALPITWRVARRLPDRGYILAKPLGAMLVALVIWLLVWTRLFMNTVGTAWLAVGLTAIAGIWLGWRQRAEIGGWLAVHKRLVLIEEAIFAVVFIGWVLFRLGNPDLWHPYFGGEKPMEMTHLLGILKSAYFPPYDPWFADGYINYYYYGQYLVATWIKLTGINPGIAFNLAVPLIYAFVCTAAFSLVFNLTSRYKAHRARFDQKFERGNGPVWAGLFGVVIFALIGNMDGMLQLLQRVPAFADLANKLKLYPGQVNPLVSFDYFRSSRITPGTINEFPSFSFIYSDLHAHLLALPYTLITLALAFNLLCTEWAAVEGGPIGGGRLGWLRAALSRVWHIFDRTLITPLVLMALIGYLAATNSWDLPTYLLALTTAFFMALFRRYFVQAGAKIGLLSLLGDLVMTGVFAGIMLAGGIGLYWNFFSHFVAFFSQVKLLPDQFPLDDGSGDISARTQFRYFLVIFLLPMFIILSYLFWNVGNWLGRTRPAKVSEEWAEDEEEWDDEVEEGEPSPVVQPTLPGFSLRRQRPQPQLAFLTAGADGGSGSSFGSGGFGSPGRGPAAPAANRMARGWLIGLGVFSLLTLLVGIIAPHDWFVFSLAFALIVALVVFTFVRPFDRQRPEQVAEAVDESSIFLRVMLLAGLGVLAATEVVYLRDDLDGGEYSRMNTIFKFEYQTWALLTLGAAVGAYVVWTRWISGPALRYCYYRSLAGLVGRYAWIGFIALLVFCGALYPLQAIPVRIGERAESPLPPPTLDGRAYFKTLHSASGVPGMDGINFDLALDAQAVFEFYDKVKGTPVVLEASIFPYRGGNSFIPINTGLPTVLGWDRHERQQRYPVQVSTRSDASGEVGEIRQIYNTTSIQEALDLLNHFHVTYIHVGDIEREASFTDRATGQQQPYMSDAGFNKFQQMVKLGLLDVAYQNPGVTIFKMTAKGQSDVISGDVSQVGGDVVVSDPKLVRLQAAVQSDPNNWQAHYDLGQYYYTKRQYDKAAAELELVVQQMPNRVNPYHVLGDIYRDSGDQEKALAEYKKATEIQGRPDEMPAAFNKYGVALQAMGHYDEALAQFGLAIKANPYYNEAYFHQAEIYEAQNHIDQAIQAYQQTIANSQNKGDFWTQRATQKIRELSNK